MNNKWLITFSISAVIITVVYALSGEPHKFSPGECSICHIDEEKAPLNLKPDITSGCETCHSELREALSHPVDIYPALSVPKDMPLIEGRLTCITCHYVHPEKKDPFITKKYFLRRTVKGPFFCSLCHKTNERGHIILENVHMGSYKITDRSTRIDRLSLECIECHDRFIVGPLDSLGAGEWQHYNKKNHPIGVSYAKISEREKSRFRPVNMVSKEIRLFGGKIGCGTCHNIYSKEKYMLVLSNLKSRLCLECHIK